MVVPIPRDQTVRAAYVPSSVLAMQAGGGGVGSAMDTGSKRQTEKDLMIANGGAGQISTPS